MRMDSIQRYIKGVPRSILRYRLPIFLWLPTYSLVDLQGDLNAGITVFVLLVPQGMAYAILAGLPPVYGLYCATAPLFIYCLFGTSRQLAVGAMAITSLISAAAVQDLGYENETSDFINASLSLALWTGLIQLLMGFLGLGMLTNYLSPSVLTGFITGSGLIIALSQLKYILGLSFPRKSYSHENIGYILTHLHDINVYGLALGICATAVLYFVKTWRRSYKERKAAASSQTAALARGESLEGAPRLEISAAAQRAYKISNLSSIFAVVITTAISYAIHESVHSEDVNYRAPPIVGTVPSGLPSPSLPTLDMELLPGSITLAIISFAGNWAIAKKFAAANKYEVTAREELIATGLSNMVGSAFGSFVVAGGLARSAVNAESGARTPFAGVISAVGIILALLFLTELFFYLPMATLGAIIEVAVVSMIDFESMWQAYEKGARWDCAIMVVTFLATFFAGISIGLAVGVGLSFLAFFYRMMYPHLRIALLDDFESMPLIEYQRSSSTAPGDQEHLLQLEERGEGHSRKALQFRTEELSSPIFSSLSAAAVVVVLIDMGVPLFFANCATLKDKVLDAAAGRCRSSSSEEDEEVEEGSFDKKKRESERIGGGDGRGGGGRDGDDLSAQIDLEANGQNVQQSGHVRVLGLVDYFDVRNTAGIDQDQREEEEKGAAQGEELVDKEGMRVRSVQSGITSRATSHSESSTPRSRVIAGNAKTGGKGAKDASNSDNSALSNRHASLPPHLSSPPHAILIDAGCWGNTTGSLDLPTVQMLRELVLEVQSTAGPVPISTPNHSCSFTPGDTTATAAAATAAGGSEVFAEGTTTAGPPRRRTEKVRLGFVNMHPAVKLRLQELGLVNAAKPKPHDYDGGGGGGGGDDDNGNHMADQQREEEEKEDEERGVEGRDRDNRGGVAGGDFSGTLSEAPFPLPASLPAWEAKKVDETMFFGCMEDCRRLLPTILQRL